MSNSEHVPGDGSYDATLPPLSNPAVATQDDIDYGGQSILGDYVLLEEIGVGGMGQVFKAQHQRMDRIVALKILSSALIHNPDSVKRFYREVKAAAKLLHPHVVAAFDAGEQHGTHYLVMEYVDGETLHGLVEKQGPLDLARAVEYTLQSARGLRYAHESNVIHRDIKPSNLMVNSEGIVKILDMGLARFKEDAALATAAAPLTQAGSIMGTVAYLAPEQAADASRADHRADIYGLGCTLHFLLTGKPVYRGNVIAMVLAHASKPIPSLPEARPEVPQQLQAIFERMLAKNPADRYQSMTEVITDLESFLPDLALAGGYSPAGEVSPPPPSAARETIHLSAASTDTEMVVGPATGIKLGTFTSRLAHLDETKGPQTVLNAEGDGSTPSLVLIDKGIPGIGTDTRVGLASAGILLEEGSGIITGKAVLRADLEKQKQTAYFFKRALGRKNLFKSGDSSEFPPEVFAAAVLRKLVDDARPKIKPIRQAVLTVPACFDDVQRKSLQDAAYIAGVQPERLLNEPTAAALAWAYRHQLIGPRAAAEAPLTVLVYSLGGDCFDASLIEIEASQARVRSTLGHPKLGARDWTSRLLESVASGFVREHGIDPRQDPIGNLSLWRKCEGLQRVLSEHEQVDLVYGCQHKTLRTKINARISKERPVSC